MPRIIFTAHAKSKFAFFKRHKIIIRQKQVIDCIQKGHITDTKVKYSKDVDILMIELSSEPISHAEKKGSVIVHFNKSREPVALEILDAKDLALSVGKFCDIISLYETGYEDMVWTSRRTH